MANPTTTSPNALACASTVRGHARSMELGGEDSSSAASPGGKGAAMNPPRPGYYNPKDAIRDEDDAGDDGGDGGSSGEAGSDFNSDDGEPKPTDPFSKPQKATTARKRKHSPSPSPPLSPIPRSPSPCPPTDEEEPEEASGSQSVTLTFNVPKDFKGPFVVKLDSSIFAGRVHKPARLAKPAKKQQIARAVREGYSKSTVEARPGFLRLPAELRNKIYRLLFLVRQGQSFDFGYPVNFCRSAGFLRTCRQIYSEGVTILYGENRFMFEREKSNRRAYWVPRPKEIGYKDVRLFLKTIGPKSLSLIRDMTIVFEDATPATTPYLKSVEQRRFQVDEHLRDCLKLIAEHSRLRRFTMSFVGRRMLSYPLDTCFLDVLMKIQADEIHIGNPRWSWGSGFDKIRPEVRRMLEYKMTRSEKLFQTEREKEQQQKRQKK